jgi:hypothetical protein
MRSYIFSILSAVLFVAGVSAQLTVNTPTNVLSCTPLQITWTGGTAPYTLSVHDGSDPNGAALDTFSNLTGTSYTWSSVNFAANTNLDLTLRDNSGLISQSASFSVQSGGSTSCLNGTSAVPTTVVATTAASAAATPAAGATGTTPATTGQSKATPSGSSAASSTSKATSPSSSGNAAMSTSVSYGAAGVLGAVVAALFV